MSGSDSEAVLVYHLVVREAVLVGLPEVFVGVDRKVFACRGLETGGGPQVVVPRAVVIPTVGLFGWGVPAESTGLKRDTHCVTPGADHSGRICH